MDRIKLKGIDSFVFSHTNVCDARARHGVPFEGMALDA